jgi:8-oxo-dGTP pyrophosphatase MutT (NUDIX family)
LRASFVAGAYVFPGGAVDLTDGHAAHVVHGRSDVEANAVLGLDDGGLAYWVAVVRECFEEAGVLLALDADERVVSFDDDVTRLRFSEHRLGVHDGTLRLADLLDAEGLRLAAAELHYVSHWITPIGEPRRFDTRFFVARAPSGQMPLHDDLETIESQWVRPCDALAAEQRGEIMLILPTQRNLEFLAHFADVDELLAAASIITDPVTVLPQIVRSGQTFDVLLPTDPGYDVAVAHGH